jgi:hypothetical protein
VQAIRKHKFVHILDEPGSADLSAYVDFTAIKHSAEEVSGLQRYYELLLIAVLLALLFMVRHTFLSGLLLLFLQMISLSMAQ